MMISAFKVLLLVGSAVSSVVHGAAVAHVNARDGSRPSLPYDPNTTPYCTWWIDLTISKTCDQVVAENFIDLATFRRWNPSLAERCFVTVGRSYCVEAFGEPPRPTTTSTTTIPAVTTTSRATTTTTTRTTTTTTPGNGIATPTPMQPNMVSNCDSFYLVRNGDTCDSIAAAHGILPSMFRTWNPNVGSNCGGLWRDAYACVSILGVGSRPASDFPERVLDKIRAAERTITIMGPDVGNWVLRAVRDWPVGSQQQDAANTFSWFWPITNTQLTQATSQYVNGLLSGPRPSILSSRKRRDGVEDIISSWDWSIASSNETVDEDTKQYWRRSGITHQLEARDLYDDVLSICRASLRTWSIMGPDVHNMANEAAAWWSGTPQSLSREFAATWEVGSGEQIGILQWFIGTLERTGRP